MMKNLPEVGNGGGSGFPAVSVGNKKNKYQRMDSDAEESQNHREAEARNSRTRKYVMACAFFASLNNVLLGYGRFYLYNRILLLLLYFVDLQKDVGVMSGAVLFIQQDLKITEVQTEVLIGSLSIISLFGSLAGGRTSDSIGRKWTMALAALVFQTGAAVMAVAPSFEVLMIGRTLAGIGIGLGVMIAPVYIAEISPTVARGFFTSFPEIFINLGILLGYVSNYAFSGLSVHISWRIMLAVGILPSVFIGFALCVIPESPRWLVMKGRVDSAREVLMKTNERDDEAEERLAEIQLAAAHTEGSEDRPVWRELLSPSPVVRKMLIVGFGIQCFQQITGIDATVYYSPEILKEAGIQDETKLLAATVAVGVTKTVFILFATFLIDSVGRKPLLYVSTIGMTLCLFCLSFTLTFLGQGTLGITLALLFVCGNVAFFSIGMGPVCWVLTSEIFPLRLRAQASALGAVGNRVCSGLVAMSFLSVSRAITVGGTFFVFSLVSALSVIFVYVLVPETSGKSLEQIELMFQGGLERKDGEVELGDAERLVRKEQEF
nr:putative sugar transporter [Arabidopsis thaliana]